MTECYECAKLAELVAENSQLRVKVDELANDGKAPEKVVTTESVGANDVNAALDSREKLEADVERLIGKIQERIFSGRDAGALRFQLRELLDRQAAITERHILTHPAERDEQIVELQAKVDELTAEIDALEYVGVLGEQIGRCKACKFAGIHDGKRWPGHEFKGRMYCTAWSDGYMAEWTKPDGFCHMWKPKEGDE